MTTVPKDDDVALPTLRALDRLGGSASREGAPAIDLVDGELLCDLLRGRGLGVIVREVRIEEVGVDAAFLQTI